MYICAQETRRKEGEIGSNRIPLGSRHGGRDNDVICLDPVKEIAESQSETSLLAGASLNISVSHTVAHQQWFRIGS